jgi:hypothetical protein
MFRVALEAIARAFCNAYSPVALIPYHFELCLIPLTVENPSPLWRPPGSIRVVERENAPRSTVELDIDRRFRSQHCYYSDAEQVPL